MRIFPGGFKIFIFPSGFLVFFVKTTTSRPQKKNFKSRAWQLTPGTPSEALLRLRLALLAGEHLLPEDVGDFGLRGLQGLEKECPGGGKQRGPEQEGWRVAMYEGLVGYFWVCYVCFILGSCVLNEEDCHQKTTDENFNHFLARMARSCPAQRWQRQLCLRSSSFNMVSSLGPGALTRFIIRSFSMFLGCLQGRHKHRAATVHISSWLAGRHRPMGDEGGF